MGLLDKAKEKKQDDGADASEPEVKEEASTTDEMRSDSAPKKKKMVKKKKVEKSSGKMKLGKKPGLKKTSSGTKKKKPAKKKMAKPRKEKVEKEPVEPNIEGLPEDLEFASIKNRILAQVIDGVLLGFTMFILFIILLLSIGDAGLFAAIGMYFILPIAYYVVMEGKDGQTVGKGMAHVKVISLDGRPLTLQRVMKSAVAKGLLFPIVNILDAIFGVFFQHTDTQQRYTQYETDLIVIAVAKKQLKFGYGMDEEGEDEGSEVEDGGADDAPAEEVTEEK